MQHSYQIYGDHKSLEAIADEEETVSRRDFIEARLGRPLREIPAGLAAVFADCLPIIDETNKLLDDAIT